MKDFCSFSLHSLAKLPNSDVEMLLKSVVQMDGIFPNCRLCRYFIRTGWSGGEKAANKQNITNDIFVFVFRFNALKSNFIFAFLWRKINMLVKLYRNLILTVLDILIWYVILLKTYSYVIIVITYDKSWLLSSAITSSICTWSHSLKQSNNPISE